MSDSTITCPRCGSTMPEGGRFCMNCGHIMESPVEQPATETETTPEVPDATEPGMPGESIAMSTDTNTSDEGAAIVSGSIGSTQAEISSDDSPDNQTEQPGSEMQSEETSTPPETWYASLASSPGEANSTPDESSTSSTELTPEAGMQRDPEPQSMSEVAAPSRATEEPQSSPVYSSPPPSSQWQPGTYDMGATQPVDIPLSGQAPSAPTQASANQPQSIFAAPPPPVAPQGQYTQPHPPQQGYSPPTYAPQQTFTPPPGYSNQGLPPTGTQSLQPGQPYPNYQQYPPGYPAPQQATTPKDPTTALMLELLGYLGFLGVGHIYAGKTNRGIALLIGWLAYLVAAFVLTICLVGCLMFLAWLIVPVLSGLWVKNEMEKERITGFRQ